MIKAGVNSLRHEGFQLAMLFIPHYSSYHFLLFKIFLIQALSLNNLGESYITTKNICYATLPVIIWRPPKLSEITPIILNMGLTHLGSEASIFCSPIDYMILSKSHGHILKNE